MNARFYLAILCLALTACTTTVPENYTVCRHKILDYPELSEKVQGALDSAGMTNIQGYAYLSGFICEDSKSSDVWFEDKSTGFHFLIQVNNLANFDSLGNMTAQALAVLDNFPAESVRGSSLDRIGLEFFTDQDERSLWVPVEQAKDALERGLNGAALLEALDSNDNIDECVRRTCGYPAMKRATARASCSAKSGYSD